MSIEYVDDVVERVAITMFRSYHNKDEVWWDIVDASVKEYWRKMAAEGLAAGVVTDSASHWYGESATGGASSPGVSKPVESKPVVLKQGKASTLDEAMAALGEWDERNKNGVVPEPRQIKALRSLVADVSADSEDSTPASKIRKPSMARPNSVVAEFVSVGFDGGSTFALTGENAGHWVEGYPTHIPNHIDIAMLGRLLSRYTTGDGFSVRHFRDALLIALSHGSVDGASSAADVADAFDAAFSETRTEVGDDLLDTCGVTNIGGVLWHPRNEVIAAIRAAGYEKPVSEKLDDDARIELVNKAVASIVRNFANEPAAWNAWNNLNSTPEFIEAFKYFHPTIAKPVVQSDYVHTNDRDEIGMVCACGERFSGDVDGMFSLLRHRKNNGAEMGGEW